MTDRTPPQERERVALSLDAQMAAEDGGCATSCGACLTRCGDTPRNLSFEMAVLRRDLWMALRFAATDQAIAQLDEWASRLGIAPCGVTESVLDFHVRIVDAALAAVAARVRAEMRETVSGMKLPKHRDDGCECSICYGIDQQNAALDAVIAALAEETTG